MRKVLLSAALFFILIMPAVVFSQNDSSDSSTVISDPALENKDTDQNFSKEAVNKEIKKETTEFLETDLNNNSKKTAEQEKTAAVKNTLPVKNENGLLEINDDELKDRRIPGIAGLNKKKQAVKVPEETTNIPDDKQLTKSKEPDGIFGLKKSTSGLLVKILLVFFIIAIIVLFKIRPKVKSNGKVVRRFPGSK